MPKCGCSLHRPSWTELREVVVWAEHDWRATDVPGHLVCCHCLYRRLPLEAEPAECSRPTLAGRSVASFRRRFRR